MAALLCESLLCKLSNCKNAKGFSGKQVSPSGAGSHTLLRDLNMELWNKDLANNGGKTEVFNDLKTQF